MTFLSLYCCLRNMRKETKIDWHHVSIEVLLPSGSSPVVYPIPMLYLCLSPYKCLSSFPNVYASCQGQGICRQARLYLLHSRLSKPRSSKSRETAIHFIPGLILLFHAARKGVLSVWRFDDVYAVAVTCNVSCFTGSAHPDKIPATINTTA